MNEKGVGVSESTCSAKIVAQHCTKDHPRTEAKECALLGIQELSKIVLERAENSRQAV